MEFWDGRLSVIGGGDGSILRIRNDNKQGQTWIVPKCYLSRQLKYSSVPARELAVSAYAITYRFL